MVKEHLPSVACAKPSSCCSTSAITNDTKGFSMFNVKTMSTNALLRPGKNGVCVRDVSHGGWTKNAASDVFVICQVLMLNCSRGCRYFCFQIALFQVVTMKGLEFHRCDVCVTELNKLVSVVCI